MNVEQQITFLTNLVDSYDTLQKDLQRDSVLAANPLDIQYQSRELSFQYSRLKTKLQSFLTKQGYNYLDLKNTLPSNEQGNFIDKLVCEELLTRLKRQQQLIQWEEKELVYDMQDKIYIPFAYGVKPVVTPNSLMLITELENIRHTIVSLLRKLVSDLVSTMYVKTVSPTCFELYIYFQWGLLEQLKLKVFIKDLEKQVYEIGSRISRYLKNIKIEADKTEADILKLTFTIVECGTVNEPKQLVDTANKLVTDLSNYYNIETKPILDANKIFLNFILPKGITLREVKKLLSSNTQLVYDKSKRMVELNLS